MLFRSTALAAEAQRRGNSTSLVGTVVPMLPEKLSHGLCSLVEGEDRLCKAVLLTFDAKGALAATDFAETVIRSRKRLTYRQAHALMFNDDLEGVRALPPPPRHRTGSSGRALRDVPLGELRDLQRWVRALWNIGRRLRADRMAHGSLDLDMPETRILVDAEGRAEALERIEHDESHQLVEEFMLAANEAVARLTRARRLPSLYRVHDDPEPARLLELRESLAASGIKVGDLSLRREFTRLLSMLATHPQGHTLRIQLLRSLRKAEYRYTPDGHFGLHKRDYTHFTSPIRRYADLVVHRAVAAHLAAAGAGKGHDLAHVNRLGDHLTKTEVNSAEAERESIKVKLVEYFDRKLGREPPARFAAIITDVRPHGFFIELTESLIHEAAVEMAKGRADAGAGPTLPYGDMAINYAKPFVRVTFGELFERGAGFSMFDEAKVRAEAVKRHVADAAKLDHWLLVEALFEIVGESKRGPFKWQMTIDADEVRRLWEFQEMPISIRRERWKRLRLWQKQAIGACG
mgnify:CR=1 FL=1